MFERLASSNLTSVHQVKDEKGRRRLHGAFTGGFSAGYFNTVGSKEGVRSQPAAVGISRT
jgi:hypothetical protein